MDNITASNFGKADNNASSADIVCGIYSLVLENAIQTGCMLANQIGVSSIVLIGGLCNSDELPKNLEIFKQMYPNLNFITAKNGSYITAIGTAVGTSITH